LRIEDFIEQPEQLRVKPLPDLPSGRHERRSAAHRPPTAAVVPEPRPTVRAALFGLSATPDLSPQFLPKRKLISRCQGTRYITFGSFQPAAAVVHVDNLQLQKSPSRIFGQNSGNSVDISKAFFEVVIWKFESSQVSQPVRQLEIVHS
jgi:hypothetical protein